MTEPKTCENCQHFKEEINWYAGECRRRSPQMSGGSRTVVDPYANGGTRIEPTSHSGWPRVKKDDSCGEYERGDLEDRRREAAALKARRDEEDRIYREQRMKAYKEERERENG